ncbi:MAG: type II toxin-antitoxin system HicB family antitoxin, partial [Pseudanabaena sp.]
KLIGAEVVSLEIEIPQPENPWLRFAGVFKDDPSFDRMQEDIAEYRREKDAELDNYYHQSEMEESKEQVL